MSSKNSIVSKALDMLEPLIYGQRLIVAVGDIAGSFVFLFFTWNYLKEALHACQLMVSEVDRELAVIEILAVLDGIMIIQVCYLVIAGTWKLYVRGPHTDKESGIPLVVMHLDSGLLKEKVASSLVMVSGINLLRVLMEHDGEWIPALLIHLTFLATYWWLHKSNINSKIHGGSSEETVIHEEETKHDA